MIKLLAITPEFKVSNFKESFNFYTQLVGFRVLYQRPESDFAMLDMDGSRLMIEGLTDKSRTWKTGELERPFGRGMHLQIEVRAVQDLYDNFRRVKWPIFHDIEEKWYRVENHETGNKQFLVQDPDGYLLRFFEDIGARTII